MQCCTIKVLRMTGKRDISTIRHILGESGTVEARIYENRLSVIEYFVISSHRYSCNRDRLLLECLVGSNLHCRA